MVLDRIDREHDEADTALPRRMFTLLEASRGGLTEGELISLLGDVPQAIFAPLRLALDAFTAVSGGAIHIAVPEFRQAVRQHYRLGDYRKLGDISYICRKNKVSKASLMRWNKRYDGSAESLAAKSYRPHHQHPNAHSQEKLTWIRNLHRRNPNISVCEMYGKLRIERAYSRHPGSLYRVFARLGFRKQVESTKKKSRLVVPKGADTNAD